VVRFNVSGLGLGNLELYVVRLFGLLACVCFVSCVWGLFMFVGFSVIGKLVDVIRYIYITCLSVGCCLRGGWY